MAAHPFVSPCHCLPVPPPLPSGAPRGWAQCTSHPSGVAALPRLEPNRPLTEVEKPKNCHSWVRSPVIPPSTPFAAVVEHRRVSGRRGALATVTSLNFRPEKREQHHFLEWRLGPLGRRRGKHMLSCTPSTKQPAQAVSHHSPLPSSTGRSPSAPLRAAGLR